MKQTELIASSGRALIGAVFLLSGISKVFAPIAIEGYIASVGLPAPTLGYIIALIVEIGGGALLLIGFKSRLVASLLSIFAAATAILFHRNFGDQNTMINFMKNVMIIGGLLQIVAFGATSPSVDARRVAL